MSADDVKNIIEGYRNAWTSGDLAAARSFLADDLDFQGAVERHDSADGFLGGLTMFREGLYKDYREISAIYDGNESVHVYDCGLVTGEDLRCAEHFVVDGGKITQIHLVFDTAKIPPPPPAQ